MKPLGLFAVLVVSAFSVVAPHVRAQDVSVTPFAWVNRDAPDQMPVLRHALQPAFPRDLRNTPDFGWVAVDFFIDEKGKSMGGRHEATLPAYRDALERELIDIKFEPGRRAGQPVITHVRYTVIFNPASAAPNTPEATPRLLDARPFTDPSRRSQPNGPALESQTVWATVSLDEQGNPVAVKGASPELTPLLEKNVRLWKFEPARHAGQPVAAEVRVPFILIPGAGGPPPRNQTQPRPLSQTRPIYPYAQRASGLRGDVLVDFIVDIEGRVTNAFVVRTLNPAFNESALEAVRAWKFEPGRSDGLPVSTHMQVPVQFQLNGAYDGGDSGVTIEQRGKQDKLPPEYRYDVAPKPRNRVLPVYPYALLREGTNGAATVRFLIGDNGRVVLADVLKTTNLEFGAALLAAVEQFEFEPAMRAGQPTKTILSFEQEFSAGDATLVSDDDSAMLALEKKHPERILGASKLDVPLKPTSRPPPVFPLSLVGKVPKGSATIEFLVDEEGRTRLPRVSEASDAAFGYAAVQSVAAWRFEAPKVGGKSVTVRVKAPFTFKAPAPPPAPAKPATSGTPAPSAP